MLSDPPLQVRVGLETRDNVALGNPPNLVEIVLREARLVAAAALPALVVFHNGGSVVGTGRIDKLVGAVFAILPARS